MISNSSGGSSYTEIAETSPAYQNAYGFENQDAYGFGNQNAYGFENDSSEQSNTPRQRKEGDASQQQEQLLHQSTSMIQLGESSKDEEQSTRVSKKTCRRCERRLPIDNFMQAGYGNTPLYSVTCIQCIPEGHVVCQRCRAPRPLSDYSMKQNGSRAAQCNLCTGTRKEYRDERKERSK